MKPFTTILILTLASVLHAEAQVPPAPEGFAWQRLAPIKSLVLKPDGWFYKHEKKGETDGFFISREDVNQSRRFRTGLTLNCVRDVPGKTGRSPSVYAASLVEAAAADHSLTDRSSSEQGPFRGIVFRYVSAPAGEEVVTIHQVLIANDKTGTLFMVLFEAPTEDWEEAWLKGEVMLKRLMLDDEV